MCTSNLVFGVPIHTSKTRTLGPLFLRTGQKSDPCFCGEPRLVTVRGATDGVTRARRAAVRRGAEKVFWRAEPSRDPASATAASTSPSPFCDLSHSCRLEVPRRAVPLRGAPQRGCSTRTMRTAAFRKGCWPTSVEDGLASAHGGRTVDRFEVGLCGSRQQTCPPAEPPEVTAVAAPSSQVLLACRLPGTSRLLCSRMCLAQPHAGRRGHRSRRGRHRDGCSSGRVPLAQNPVSGS